MLQSEEDLRPTKYLGEQSIEAVNLLPLFHKRVVLCDTLQSQLVHEVDYIRLPQKSVFE